MVEGRNVLRQEVNVTLWSSLRIYLVSGTREVNLLFTNDVRNTLVVDQVSRSVGEGKDRLPVRCGEIVKHKLYQVDQIPGTHVNRDVDVMLKCHYTGAQYGWITIPDVQEPFSELYCGFAYAHIIQQANIANVLPQRMLKNGILNHLNAVS